MQDIKVLEQVGLAKNDRTIYLLLLEFGVSTVSELVKKTGMHRSYIYEILEKLIGVGLAGFVVKNNKKYFEAAVPEKIIEILDSKEQELKQNKQEIEKVLPELKKINKINAVKQEAKIFLGKQGIKSILEDVLSTRKDFVAFGAEGRFKNIYKWYYDNWQKRRIKQRIKYKIIYKETLRNERQQKQQTLAEVKFISKIYDFPATTIVYGNKVAIITWEQNPIAFLLENEQTAKSFTSYFEILWQNAEY